MKIFVTHVSAGYGHKKVAETLYDEFTRKARHTDQIDIIDVLDFSNLFFRFFYPFSYYFCVAYLPALWGFLYNMVDRKSMYTLVRPIRTIVNRACTRALIPFMKESKPDVVICTHFLPTQVLGKLKEKGEFNAIIANVVTDFSAHSFWVNDGVDVYFVPAEVTKEELKRWGVPEKKIKVVGIPVSKKFNRSGRRDEILYTMGLDKDRKTILMTSGSFGIGPTRKILKALKDCSVDIQVIVVCGKNRLLYYDLKRSKFSFPVKVLGFVKNMDELMEASDLLIAKPGGATTSESMVKGIPMIISSPIPGQETRNAHYLLRNSAAIYLRQPEEISAIINSLLTDPEKMSLLKSALAKLATPSAASDLVDHVLQL